MTAKEYLSQARQIDQRIEARCEERERLMSRLTTGRMTHLTGMPRGGGYDWTDALAKLVELDRQLGGEIMELCRLKREINETIDRVEDMTYRRLLELRYRNYMRWDDIADTMGYDVRWVYVLHGRALREVKVPETETVHCNSCT